MSNKPTSTKGEGWSPKGGSLRAQLRRPLPFPLGAPTWPTAVPRPRKQSDLGDKYDTEWARRYPVRLARAAWTEIVTRPVMAAVAQPSVEGLDRLDHTGAPVIFASNHASHLDTPLVLSVLPDKWRHKIVTLAAADYFFDSRLKAIYFAFSLNAVPIERARVSRDSADRAEELLAEGWNLLIFPEGGRSPDGWGQEHRGGAAWLAARSGRPLVPLHIQGTGRLWPRGAKRIYTGRTKVTFGAPIYPDLPARQLVARLEAAIAALADETGTDWWSARKRAATGTTPALTGPDAAPWRRAWALGPSPKDSARRRAPAGEKRWPPKS
ncbi:MAG: lysophospholipid acyltransferase family protein [Acidimicrobiales bacterium]